MKFMFISFAILTALATTAAADAVADVQFSCYNHMYRDSKINFQPTVIEVQDSMISNPAYSFFKTLAEVELGPQRLFYPGSMKLTMERETIGCTGGAILAKTCSGGIVPINAKLQLSGMVIHATSGAGQPYRVTFLFNDVKVSRLDLRTTLSSRGPVVVGPGPAKVAIDQLNLEMNATIQTRSGATNLELKTFFYPYSTGREKDNSSCEIKTPVPAPAPAPAPAPHPQS